MVFFRKNKLTGIGIFKNLKQKKHQKVDFHANFSQRPLEGIFSRFFAKFSAYSQVFTKRSFNGFFKFANFSRFFLPNHSHLGLQRDIFCEVFQVFHKFFHKGGSSMVFQIFLRIFHDFFTGPFTQRAPKGIFFSENLEKISA